MKKIAFLFLILDNPNFPKIWNKYFKGNKEKYSIYIHPKYIEKVTWKKNNVIKNIVSTSWGFITKAYMELFKIAYKDENNYKFVTISESCVPIQTFDNFYNDAINDPRSWIKKMKISKYDYEYRIEDAKKKTVHKLVPSYFLKNYARFCLNRDHVQLLLQKNEELKFFHNMHVGDEFFLSVLNPIKNVRDFAVTFDDWDYIRNLIKNIINKIKELYKKRNNLVRNNLVQNSTNISKNSNNILKYDNEIIKLKKEKEKLYEISKNPKTIVNVKEDLDKIKNCTSYFYRKFSINSNIEKYWKEIIIAHNKV
jgi:hypothetical protein